MIKFIEEQTEDASNLIHTVEHRSIVLSGTVYFQLRDVGSPHWRTVLYIDSDGRGRLHRGASRVQDLQIAPSGLLDKVYSV